MDFSKKYDNPNPEPQANLLSKLFFTWEIPLIKKRIRGNLQIQDLYNARHSDKSELLADALEINWNKELEKAKLKGRKPKLINALYETFKKPYWICGILLLLHALFIRSFTPVILSKLLLYFDIDDVTVTKQEGCICAVLLVLFTITSSTLMFHCGTMLRILGMRGRIAACSMMYRKMLRLSQTALNEAATGKVVNLMSNDVNRFDAALELIHYIWIIPFQMIVVAYFMFMTMGYAAFGGILVIALQAEPLQGMISRKIARLRSVVAKRTDERVRLMNEIVNGIQVIKMYAWEKPFEAVVRLSRKHEIDILLIASYLRGFSAALIVYIERCALYVTIVIYVSTGNNLNANEVFSMAQFFNTLQMYFAQFFSQAVVWRNEGLVSVKRIEEFLLLEENNEAGSICNTYGNSKSGTIVMQNINATWGGQNTNTQTLSDINLQIKPGQLCAIIGPVGSGKSSILNLLLRELPLSSGVMNVNGRISFCPQVPWLFQGSIRNNVLFGQEFDEYKYNETVKVCALARDFELFPYGDKTLVGDRGASLSGGQKARVNLARTVYREADIYLFDDPCSAVDTQVGKHLFDQCIYKHLNNKTRILVTHQLQYLKDADIIVVLNNGSIVKTGTWDEISKDESIVECIKTSEVEYDQIALGRTHTLSECSELIHAEIEEEEEELKAQTLTNNVNGDPQEVGETMEVGTMRFKLFWKYMRAGASKTCIAFLTFSLIIAQTCCTGVDFWLTKWTNWEDIRRYYLTYIGDSEVDSVPLNLTTEINATLVQDDPYLKEFAGQIIIQQQDCIFVYSVLIVLSIILTTLSRLLLYKVAMKSSTNLHDTMFTNILQATMRFFDTNPSGRILNRFSKDMGAIDELLPRALLDAVQILISMFGIITMVAFVNPWLIAIMFVAGFLFKKLAIMYMKTAQDIKRLEAVTRSPAFSQVSTSLNGLTTIRSCGAQMALQKQFDEQQDVHTGAFYMTILLTSGFGYWLDCVCMTFLGCVTFSFLISGPTFSGNVGLAISQTMALTGVLQYGIRQFTEVMNQMTSVERVLQYTNLDKENQFDAEPAKDTSNWPTRGKVDFKHTYLTYVPEDGPILKDLNVQIIAGDKIGIVGRTGAGKSSLIAALFRLAPLEGQICIDDVDSKSVSLKDLRTKISIIPQQPVLFSATLRYNLDPFNEVNDDALWRALEEVELKDVVDNLDCKVNEGGSNFSVGQRQLLCLARAIVRNNKVLVLDEATANVDLRTDALIQTTIREKFTHCTVLTIAHRLNTIMDSDKVLVMDAGTAVEFDHPYFLLQDPNSYFSKMVAETGKSMEMQLRQVARESFENKNNTKL